MSLLCQLSTEYVQRNYCVLQSTLQVLVMYFHRSTILVHTTYRVRSAKTSVYKPIKSSDHYPSKIGRCRSDTLTRGFRNSNRYLSHCVIMSNRSWSARILFLCPEVEIENTAYGTQAHSKHAYAAVCRVHASFLMFGL